MSSNIVSHNTESMRSWSKNMDGSAGEFDALINKLYTLIEQFAGSKDFSGGLSTTLLDKVLSQKSKFLSYSQTFREASELINRRATKIDNDEATLVNKINQANPLD